WDFQGGLDVDEKRGGGRGGSKVQNSRGIRGSKWSEAVYFERILVGIVRVWAHLSSFSSNPCSKAVQNDHIPHGSDIKHAHPFNANRYKDCSTFAVHGHRN